MMWLLSLSLSISLSLSLSLSFSRARVRKYVLSLLYAVFFSSIFSVIHV